MVQPLDAKELVTNPSEPVNLEEMVMEAALEYQQGSRLEAAKLVSAILEVDFNHPGAWTLLHSWYGEGKSFRKFQLDFVLKYYPARVGQLKRVPNPLPLQILSRVNIPPRGERMNFCPVCGLKNERQGRFCPQCGESLVFSKSPAEDAPPATPTLPVEYPEVGVDSTARVNLEVDSLRPEEIWMPEEQIHTAVQGNQAGITGEAEITRPQVVAVPPAPLPAVELPADEELVPIAQEYISPRSKWSSEGAIPQPVVEVKAEGAISQPEGSAPAPVSHGGEEYLPEWLSFSQEFQNPPAGVEEQKLSENRTEDLPEWLTMSYEDVKNIPPLSPSGTRQIPDSEARQSARPAMTNPIEPIGQSGKPQEGG